MEVPEWLSQPLVNYGVDRPPKPKLSEVSPFCKISKKSPLVRFDLAEFRTSILPRAVHRVPLGIRFPRYHSSDEEWGMAPLQLLLAAARASAFVLWPQISLSSKKLPPPGALTGASR